VIHIGTDRLLSIALLLFALAVSLLGGCAHIQVDRALNRRCLAACEGWGGGGVVAICGIDGGCVCQSWEGDMVRIEGACPVLVRS